MRIPAATSARAPSASSMPAPMRRSGGGPGSYGAAGGGPGGGGVRTSVSLRETTVSSSAVGQGSGEFVLGGGVWLDKSHLPQGVRIRQLCNGYWSPGDAGTSAASSCAE